MSGWVAGAVVVAGATSAYMSSQAAKSAASTQAAAADRATAAQQAGLTAQEAISAPFVDKGTAAMNRLATMTEPGGRLTQDFAYAPFNYNQNTDPGSQFRMQQGLNAMNATAAARGGLISGNALKAGQDYGQAQGSQEYQNAFNRYLTSYNADVARANNMYNRVSGIAGTGQTTTNQLAAMAGNYGQNASNTILGQGANRANSELQLGNIRGSQYGNIGNAIGQIGGMFGGSMFGGGGGTYSGPSYGTNPNFNNSYFDTMSFD